MISCNILKLPKVFFSYIINRRQKHIYSSVDNTFLQDEMDTKFGDLYCFNFVCSMYNKTWNILWDAFVKKIYFQRGKLFYYDHCICISYAGHKAQSDVELLRRFYDVVVLDLPSSNMPHSSFNQRVQSHILLNDRLCH